MSNKINKDSKNLRQWIGLEVNMILQGCKGWKKTKTEYTKYKNGVLIYLFIYLLLTSIQEKIY